jgi:hypothetical protein
MRPLLSSADLAALLGWSVERTRDWMIREAVGFRMGARYYTTPTRLRDAFPDVYSELFGDVGA